MKALVLACAIAAGTISTGAGAAKITVDFFATDGSNFSGDFAYDSDALPMWTDDSVEGLQGGFFKTPYDLHFLVNGVQTTFNASDLFVIYYNAIDGSAYSGSQLTITGGSGGEICPEIRGIPMCFGATYATAFGAGVQLVNAPKNGATSLPSSSYYPGFGTAGYSYTFNGVITSGANAEIIAVTAVPEAATWVLMIGGMGIIGGTLRRSRRANVAVTYA